MADVWPDGYAIEEWSRRIAAGLGVPDFVYRPVQVQKGSAQREVSDGLLICGSEGVILQVKSRDRAIAASDTSERARAWCDKNIAAAIRQGRGTRRHFETAESVSLTSFRGHDKTVSGAVDWPIVVVVDHPSAEGVQTTWENDAVVMTTADWRALHAMVMSTAGVIDYVGRVLASRIEVPLGAEAGRYAVLSDADVRSTAFGSKSAVPVLPPSMLVGEDASHANLIADLIDRVADHREATGWDPVSYLHVVESLDRIPVAVRVSIGMRMADHYRTVTREGGWRSFLATDARGADRLIIAHATADACLPEDPMAIDIVGLTTLRHHQALEGGAARTTKTLGIGVLCDPERGRRYTFVLVGDPPEVLPAPVRQHFERRFGPIASSTGRPPAPR